MGDCDIVVKRGKDLSLECPGLGQTVGHMQEFDLIQIVSHVLKSYGLKFPCQFKLDLKTFRHTLSAHFGLAHSMANATVLPYVMEYNALRCPEKMVHMAQVIGLETSGNPEEDKYLLAKELLKLTESIGIKKLSEQGIKEEDFDMLAEVVLHEPVLGFNPRQNITKEDIIAILKKAYLNK